MEDKKKIYEYLTRLDKEIPEDVKLLISDVDALKKIKPFTRGGQPTNKLDTKEAYLGQKVMAHPSTLRKFVIDQDYYVEELDPLMHKVNFDENLPSIVVKYNDGNIYEVQTSRVSLPIQQSIRDKQTLHLAAMPMSFNMIDEEPTDLQNELFIEFKKKWEERNQDGMKTKAVHAVNSYGDAGWLFYKDRHGKVKSRLLSYDKGYVICSHNDRNEDRIVETVIYLEEGTPNVIIDSWDDKYMYRYAPDEQGQYGFPEVTPHGFSEIPLITHRAPVSWENAQSLIENLEAIYNIFVILQKKWGWGLLYVKGRVDENAKKMLGHIVLNDTNVDGKGEAKFLTPPDPSNPLALIGDLHDKIQIATGTTFILPKDIHTSSDTSGIAVQMTQSLDIQTANKGIVDWQNVANKATRLFKEGLAQELVATGERPTAITDYENLHVNARFVLWKPFSETEYNNMLCTMKQAGILSLSTAVEKNTMSRPDELKRLSTEEEEAAKKAFEQAQQQMKQAKISQQDSDNGDDNNDKPTD